MAIPWAQMRSLDCRQRDRRAETEQDLQIRELLAPSRVELEQRTAEMAIRLLVVAAVAKVLLGA